MKFSVFGEILWDVFNGDKKIGGAPFNFAAHSVRLGADVDFISAVGSDENGTDAIEQCRRLGIPTDHIAIAPVPTGYCDVTLHEGTPNYELVRNVAYDVIELPGNELAYADSDSDVFYFGTLAQRAEVSAATLKKLILGLDRSKTTVFFDINIRQNFYTQELIYFSLKNTDILKISREEIGVLGIEGGPEEICLRLLEKYPNIKLIIVTLDSDGAFACEADGTISRSSKPSCNVVSTVGAGDSFSAAFLVSYMKGLDIGKCLENAGRVAGIVCENIEAIPQYDFVI